MDFKIPALIVSNNEYFITFTTSLLHAGELEVFVATCEEEAERLRAEIFFGTVVVDPQSQPKSG